jgi:hypothetical protein
MKTNITLSILTLILSSTAFANCEYKDLIDFAVQNSLITEVYQEAITEAGGPFTGDLLAADLVSASGRREIHVVTCNEISGRIETKAKSVRRGQVVY